MRTAGIFMLWILLLGFAAFAAWMAHSSFIFVSTLIIKNPNLRPTFWSMDSLSGISRLSILLFGSCWLFFAMWSEHYLNEGSKEGTVTRRILRLVISIALIIAVAYGLLWL